MKLNNKGFAAASILYSIMVLFLMLLLCILGMLGSRKATLDKTKKDILDSLNNRGVDNVISFDYRNITIINRGNINDIMFAMMDGVTATDEKGKPIDSSNISYNLNLNNIENKTYDVKYTASINGKDVTASRKVTFVNDDISKTFDYTGSEQLYNVQYGGNYKVELWGASGEANVKSLANSIGRGAYTSGNIDLNKNSKLYIYVGSDATENPVITANSYDKLGGYNGGGAGETAGGGATDIRLVNGSWDNFNSLKSRIMVAAGGGGGAYNNATILTRGDGGKLNGIDAKVRYNNSTDYSGFGGSQIKGGEPGTLFAGKIDPTKTDSMVGTFGKGGFSINARNNYVYASSGGGGGYYGGGHGNHPGSSWTGGGGGSSFISGYDGCDAISSASTADNIVHTGQPVHYSGYRFKNGQMYAGNEVMPTQDGTGTMTGNTGNGYAKISLIYARTPIVTLHINSTAYEVLGGFGSVTFNGVNVSSATNISCDNGATPTLSGTTLNVSSVKTDTNCYINNSLNDAITKLDTTLNSIIMLKDETLASTLAINENKNVKLNLNGKTLTYNGSEYALDVTGKLNINGTAGVINGTGNSIRTLLSSELVMDGGTYNTIQLNGSSKANIKNTTHKCTNDVTNCYPILNNENSVSVYENITSTTQGKTFGMQGNSVSTLKNSTLNCPNDNCVWINTNGTLNIIDTNINSKGYSIQLAANKSGTISINNSNFHSENNTVILNNGTGTININGGKYTSNNVVVYNNNTGNINISDTNGKVYMYTTGSLGQNVWATKGITNNKAGNISIRGSVANKCSTEENISGICIYNGNGRAVLNESGGTGNIYINGAYIVGSYSAVDNYTGKTYICSAKLNGGTADIRQADNTTGNVYYKNNITLENNTKLGTTDRIILDNSITCE